MSLKHGEEIALSNLKHCIPVKTEELNLPPSFSVPIGLVIVDEVNGFAAVGSGNLAPKEPDASVACMVEETARLARAFSDRKWPILAFLDTHEPDKPEPPYPPHCIIGTGEENLVPALEWLEKDPAVTLVRKDCIDGFIGAIRKDGSNAFCDWVAANELEKVLVVGICTDICVLDFVVSILSARNHNILPPLKDVLVYSKGCSTYSLPRAEAESSGLGPYAAHPQDITHYIGLYIMAARGAVLVDTVDLM
eukprot:TRINITY_DN2464_c0_g1_i2.p1 TRINITY_DN2464_c0_g1~~TRINITY_DN2464_c0_g1_i2.p1  ORF type:complete len:250 (+),score=55.24 TRINITY_DN2464_c0_g1_i2:46-795(+)